MKLDGNTLEDSFKSCALAMINYMTDISLVDAENESPKQIEAKGTTEKIKKIFRWPLRLLTLQETIWMNFYFRSWMKFYFFFMVKTL